ncbi:DUF4265 domain-containing protein [Nonomuraea candida]|uniref:DUF4265 domain-containing protein n=1 Tax=Nonomuraea candida TaxID=359159 RepID=UPI0005BBCAB1|nr:DUF4265 domain-containing protein [Nonomuraea candida]
MTSPTPAGDDQAAGERIKLWFRFAPREGWLPYDTEGLWAAPVTSDTARIENVPFLVDGVAQGDIVRFITGTDGLHWATERVTWSGGNTIRVLPIPSGPLGRSAAAVHERLAPFGIGGEAYSADFPLVALNIPSGDSLSEIKSLLTHGQDEGWWAFEAACIGDAWNNA